MNDLISRQAAIDALCTPHGILYPIRTIEQLPSAQTERKKGSWIKKRGSGLYYCSVCGASSLHNEWPYCERCESYNGGGRG